MSDLYGINDAEDMSSFLQILLQNPPASSAAAAGMFSDGGPAAEPSTSFNFSDPGCFFSGDSDRVNPSFTFKEPETSDVAMDRAPSRSLKRSRDAEVHNLSEKNRRSRINEKLKALQTLIPNSSKTDKASMLDEAIEYLKQLQLQVQMLTLRSGVSLHSGYSMGPLQPTSAGLDPVANRGPDVYMQNTILQPIVHSNNSTLPMHMMPSTRNTNSSLGVSPSYGMFHHSGSAKMDLSRSRNNTSPGISS